MWKDWKKSFLKKSTNILINDTTTKTLPNQVSIFEIRRSLTNRPLTRIFPITSS